MSDKPKWMMDAAEEIRLLAIESSASFTFLDRIEATNIEALILKHCPEDGGVGKLSSETILNNLALVESLRKIAQWEKRPPSNLIGGQYRNGDWCQGQLIDVVEVAQAALAYYEAKK